MNVVDEQVQQLHRYVDEAEYGIHLSMLLHLLIDAKQLTALKCTYTDCVFTTREFAGKKGQSPAVDHIVSIKNGGTNRTENLQVIHRACNNRKVHFEDAVNRVGTAEMVRAWWQDPEYRAKQMTVKADAARRGWVTRKQRREAACHS